MAKCDINNKQRLFDVLKSKDIVDMANDNNIEYRATLSGSILNVSVKSGVDNAYIVQSLIENAVNNSFPGILLSSRTEDGYINTILFTERVNNTIKDKRNKRIAKLRFDRSIVRNDGEVISPSGYPAIPMANDRNGIIKNLEKQIHQEATNAWDLGEVADVSNRGVGKLINEYYKSDVVSYYDEGTDLTFARVKVPEFLVDIYYNELSNIIKERREKWSSGLMEQSSFWDENGDADQYNSISTTNTNIGSKALGFKDFVQGKQTFDKELAQKIQDKLQKLYPEIKLNITNNPVWEQGDNVFNQEEYSNQVIYGLKATKTILDNLTKIKQWESNKSIDKNTLWRKIGELGISKQQLDLLKESDGNTIEEKFTSFVTNYSYTVEINTAKEKPVKQLSLDSPESFIDDFGNEYTRDYSDTQEGFDYFKNGNLITKQQFDKEYQNSLEEVTENKNTEYYSNLTVPGGTNGSYIEANIETPMIVPSIQSHAQFKTDNTIGWMRADEKQNYQEKDIDNLIEIMKKSGILEVNCG